MKKALFILLLLPLATLAQDNLTYDKPVQSIIKSGSIDYFIQGKGGPGEKNNQICEDGLFLTIIILPFLMVLLINQAKNMMVKKVDALVVILFKMFFNRYLLILIKK
ncbi:hypothetical protein AANUM_0080 [Aggregatibacter actinomycetemcomitans NUM4039]|nr:hypothetical protein [Aggregatibacter actinomycetemcomitans]BAS47311.1 hypothetical protein AANUM_0080 [Aggregatibacter actinomycetemcomitans NUM4039]